MMTEWVWDRGVRGAVGVVGVWGRLRGGEASGADLDNVTLDTRLSWGKQTKRKTVNDFCVASLVMNRANTALYKNLFLLLGPSQALATVSLVDCTQTAEVGGGVTALKPVIGSHLPLSPIPPNKAVMRKSQSGLIRS